MSGTYVGTPSYVSSDVNTLASILQGESSTVDGMTAVANVIQNRASSNYSGYGLTLMDQALAPMQFQGQTTPGTDAIAVAQRAIDGTLPNIAGNALNYATQAGTTAKWALAALARGAGTVIGGNTFWANDKGDPISGATNKSVSGSVSVAPDYTQMDFSSGLKSSDQVVKDSKTSSMQSVSSLVPQSVSDFFAKASQIFSGSFWIGMAKNILFYVVAAIIVLVLLMAGGRKLTEA